MEKFINGVRLFYKVYRLGLIRGYLEKFVQHSFAIS